MFKYAVIILLILIIYNLIMGFVYILKDKSSSKRGLTSLKTRIVLSLLLFILLIVGFYADL
jgi:succinate dehydrogenase/fumarate reductase cytochrome b subunit